MEIIDGKQIATEITEKVADEIKANKLQIGLAVILIGNDSASELYVKLKKKACIKVGIDFHLYRFPDNTNTDEVIEAIKFLNEDRDINAILVQLPLPKELDTKKIIAAIDPKKDVDGFHPINIQKYINGEIDFLPGLNEGINILLASTKQDLTNKKICILANSDEFAEPLEKYFTNQGLNTKHIHLTDPDWTDRVKEADILITAVGKALLITKDNIKEDAIIIDVGTNRLTKNTIVGDVDFESVCDKCSYITPVPGGVGPMTIAMLLKNSVRLAR
ncbi:bifunctional 5,10-methylene-tetrahydrofolate dehydrogenase/5,10-methylene-tetrahydrofolate cyclohydrolase [Patescibacteria group bacterium]|nr:bifunctional 5,10-methylene-tetrahydrofolate dehydrogenase/5,10-methylene-tetrahydrofolate cyclohydrolase [Patescibacteria group bacterium]